MKHFDVAIVGAGPAGATAAYKLALAGISTVIIDKEKLPRYKVCGGGLVYRGRKLLPFDISEAVEKEFKTIDVYLGNQLHFKTTREEPIISMVMRDVFDELIVNQAKTYGATLLEEQEVLQIVYLDDTVLLKTNKGDINAKLVIAADGVYSPVAKMAGWLTDTRTLIPALEYELKVSEAVYQKHSEVVRFDIDVAPGGYAWNFPKKNHLSIGVCVLKKSKVNLKKLCEDYITSLGITEIECIDKHGYQIPIAPRTDGFVKNRVFLIGDAAGFADAITAEGISNSILSGSILADVIINHKFDIKEIEKQYQIQISKNLLPELKASLKLSLWFYKFKTLRNLVLTKYGQHFCEQFADIFMGQKTYPSDLSKRLKKKLKEFVFK